MLSSAAKETFLNAGYSIVGAEEIPLQGEPLRIDIVVNGVLLTYYPPDVFIDLYSEYTPSQGSDAAVRSTTFTFYDDTGIQLEALIISGGLKVFYRFGYQNGLMTPYRVGVIVNIESDFDVSSNITLQVVDIGDFDLIFNANRTLDLKSAYIVANNDYILMDNEEKRFYNTETVTDASSTVLGLYKKQLNKLQLYLGKPETITKRQYRKVLEEYKNLLNKLKKFMDSMNSKFSESENPDVIKELNEISKAYESYSNLVSKYQNIYDNTPDDAYSKDSSSNPEPETTFDKDTKEKLGTSRIYFTNFTAGDIAYIDAKKANISAGKILRAFLTSCGISYKDAEGDIGEYLDDIEINVEKNELNGDVTTAQVIISSILRQASEIASQNKFPQGINFDFYLDSTVSGTSFHLTWNVATADGAMSAPFGAKVFELNYGACDSGRVLSFKANYSDMLTAALESAGYNTGAVSVSSTDSDSNQGLTLEEQLKKQQNLSYISHYITANTLASPLTDFEQGISTGALNEYLDSMVTNIRYSSINSDTMKGMIAAYTSALSFLSFSAEIKILGYPNIHCNDIIALEVYLKDGRTHPMSGYYLIFGVKDEITDGLYTTTLQMFKQPEPGGTDISMVEENTPISTNGDTSIPVSFQEGDEYLDVNDAQWGEDGTSKHYYSMYLDFLNSAFGNEFVIGEWLNVDNIDDILAEDSTVILSDDQKKLIQLIDELINNNKENSNRMRSYDVDKALCEVFKEVFGKDDFRYIELYNELFIGTNGEIRSEGDFDYINFSKNTNFTFFALRKSKELTGDEALGTIVKYQPIAPHFADELIVGPSGIQPTDHPNSGLSPAIYLGKSQEYPGISFIIAPGEVLDAVSQNNEYYYGIFAVYAVPTAALRK